MINDILKEFDEQNPEVTHERMSKCDCSSEELHDTIIDYINRREKFRSFLKSALERCLDEVKIGEDILREILTEEQEKYWLDGYADAIKDLSAKISELKK